MGGRGRLTPIETRKRIVGLIDEAKANGARRWKACEVIGISVRTIERWRKEGEVKEDRRKTRIFEPVNKLTEEEYEDVLKTVNSVEFAHLPPSQIVPILAERGEYIASESTFYRVMRKEDQVNHREPSRVAKKRSKPEALSATRPNQIYSWDITYLPTSIKGAFFYLYMFIDIYSRKIVGWQVFEGESSDWAAELLCDIARRERIERKQVTLHSDNGAPMKGLSMLSMLETLEITPSFSRPAVSNDNPYSESLFKTVKYRPQHPPRFFANVNEARKWVEGIVRWYNFEHRHSGIRFVTPAQRHNGQDIEILRNRKAVYDAARRKHPERWSRQTRNCEPVNIVFLNPEKPIPVRNQESLKMAA